MSEHTKTNDAQQPAEQESCRACGTNITPDSKTYPFCSPRCRGADLLGWFDGRYKISRDVKDSDLDALD